MSANACKCTLSVRQHFTGGCVLTPLDFYSRRNVDLSLSFRSFPVKREQLLRWPCHLFIKFFSINLTFKHEAKNNNNSTLRFTAGNGEGTEESFKDKAQVETCVCAWCASCRARGLMWSGEFVYRRCHERDWKLRHKTPWKLTVGAVSLFRVWNFFPERLIEVSAYCGHISPQQRSRVWKICTRKEWVGGGRMSWRLSKPHIYFCQKTSEAVPSTRWPPPPTRKQRGAVGIALQRSHIRRSALMCTVHRLSARVGVRPLINTSPRNTICAVFTLQSCGRKITISNLMSFSRTMQS